MLLTLVLDKESIASTPTPIQVIEPMPSLLSNRF